MRQRRRSSTRIKEVALKFSGCLRVRELPADCSEADFAAWWPRLSQKERDRYTVCEAHNILTNYGRNQALAYFGTPNTLGAFAQILSIGTGAIAGVNATDTAVVTDTFFRKVPNVYAIIGTQVDISVYIGTTDAVGTWTNAGIYGGGSATTTYGSGLLMTHVLFAYAHGATNNTIDYLITLS